MVSLSPSIYMVHQQQQLKVNMWKFGQFHPFALGRHILMKAVLWRAMQFKAGSFWSSTGGFYRSPPHNSGRTTLAVLPAHVQI